MVRASPAVEALPIEEGKVQDGRMKVSIPTLGELFTEFHELALRAECIRRYITAVETGAFTHPDGRMDELGGVHLFFAQAALIAYLARRCPASLSVEVGFGMGTSACVILGARTFLGEPFEHLIFDPFGMGNGRGLVVQSYLESEFGAQFKRVYKRSVVGMGHLLEERGEGCAGLVFVDGSHHFENVMSDFALADLLCCREGYIVFDDADYPSIESVVNYVNRNRPDYAVAHRYILNTTVLQKQSSDDRQWYAFTPFKVPARSDWTPVGLGSQLKRSVVKNFE